MNRFLEMLSSGPDGTLFSPLDLLIVMVVAIVCLFVIAWTYQTTHRGTTYAQTYVHSLFLMGLCTALVMMIIGSNIARAFSLVGALSIIRFRTAVKDTRDTAFLFFAIIIGMGAGTGFFLHTAIFTVATSGFMWLLLRSDYGRKQDCDQVVKVSFRRGTSAPEAVEELLRNTFGEFRLINALRSSQDDEEINVYVVFGRKGLDHAEVSQSLAKIEHVTRATFYVNDQLVSV